MHCGMLKLNQCVSNEQDKKHLQLVAIRRSQNSNVSNVVESHACTGLADRSQQVAAPMTD